MLCRPAGWASQWVPLYGRATVTRAGEVEELPNRQPIDPRSLFAALRREESQENGKADGRKRRDSSVDESSISSDTSCSSLEFHRPHSAGVEASRSPYRNSPARLDATAGCSGFTASCVKGSTESLTRRERLDAVKARVEAKRSQYGGSSSSDDDEDVTWRENGKVTKARRRSRESSAPPRPVVPAWQESKAYQEPNNMVRRAGAVTPLTVTTTFQGPAAPVQPSPQDSGVSSQSVASSPSLGRAPTPPPRRTPSRAITRESSLLAAKPRRHSASFDQWRMEDSGIGSERKDSSFYSYADLTPAHGVKARVRGPAYSYTDQAPLRPDSAGAYMSDPQRTDMRFFGLAPGHRRASISAEVLDLTPRSDTPPRRPRPLSMVVEKTRSVPPPVPRQRPVTGNTSSLEAARRRLDDVIQRERDRRSSANLETALNELEEIYNSLRLNEDEDLLFRAERRDLPTKWPMTSPIAVWPSRSLPARNGAHTPPPRKDVSYMLCSAAFTPSLHVHPALMDVSLAGEPDIEKDDMCYRNYTQADALRVPPPQPPFGIPLVPTQGTTCDYIRARPPDAPRPLTRPKVHPDLVRDDMAFRNLRKDPAVSLAARRSTRALSVSVASKATSPSDKQQDKSQSMTSIMEALQKESQRWKRLDEGVTHAPNSAPGTHNHVSNNGPDWSAARQRGKIVPMEDCQLDALLASLTPPPVPTPGERRLRTGVRIPA
ncbi:hypothetical protein HPB52_017695 [Rhipicephalus sanguineus]|uniref:Uncharacterized protein n=1 Tax=Rhipicephalus sanguineus TaxID=34632 RepID=A0A9D4SZG4_RHISA|nr:hypothetical protein HPB52_017695 [Rhipicephalus sanguineus]